MVERITPIYEEVMDASEEKDTATRISASMRQLAERAELAMALQGGELSPAEEQRFLERLCADRVHGC